MDWAYRVRHFWQSYTGRMVLGVLAIHLVLVPILFYGLLYITERNIKSQFIDQIRYNTFLYTSLMKHAIADQDVEEQVNLLNEILLHGDVIFSELDKGNTVIRPDLNKDLPDVEFREDFEFGTHGDNVYFIALELFDEKDGEYIGTIKLGYDEVPVQKQIATASYYVFIIASGYFILSITLVIYFGQHLMRPIDKLRSLSRNIMAGDKEASLNVNTGIAEIRYLANDLETMRNILFSRHNDIANKEKRLRAILDNAGEGIISINEKGTIQSFNKAAESIFGYTEQEVVGNNVSMLMPASDRERHDEYINNYLESGVARIIGIGRRLQGRHKSGRPVPIFLNVSKFRHNSELTFIGIIHDLSKEVALESQLSQFLHAIEQSPVSIMITDTSATINYVNPFFCNVTGYSEEEVIGKNPNILKSGETQDDVYQDLWNTITSGGVWRGTLQNRKKNGELFWESATICPVFDADGNIINYIALKEDITEQRMKDMMLQQAMKLEIVGKMTSGIAHDFNNLLTIIFGNLQFLKEELNGENDEEKLLLINDAYSAARDGSKMIKQLLTFSHQRDAEAEYVNITLFLNKLERLLNRIISENIVLRINVPDTDNMVFVDPMQLESAVLNLVVNARDAMPNGGELTISSELLSIKNPYRVERGYINPGRYIVIRVSDTGTGIDERVRHKILDPFFSTKTSTTGTGLGLSMVHDFVLQAGGGIAISSRVDKGTTIDLILPEYEATEETGQDEEKSLENSTGGNETILVVEDKENVRRFACRALKKLGYHLIEASNADEALKHIQTGKKIDLLFSDIVMPGNINGRQLANIVSSRDDKINVLLTTGIEIDENPDPDSGKEFAVLYKPYTIQKLAEYIRKTLDRNS